MDYDVLVVSGYPLMVEGLRTILERLGGIASNKIFATTSGKKAIQAIDDIVTTQGRTGVVIADAQDAHAREISGLEVLEYVRKHCPSVPVIITSGEEPSSYAECVVGKGAYAYFQKEDDVNVLPGLVRSALAKQNKT